MQPMNYLRKYLVMGSQNCAQDPEIILREAISGGITAFQFREKGSGSLEGPGKIALGRKLRAICHEHGIPFFINDDVALASILKVDGIHVGQDDIPVKKLRKLFPTLHIGLSISNEDELKQSDLRYVDYVGAGPIFPTSTKEDAKAVVGVEWIRKLRTLQTNLPIVAIGGINNENAQLVIQAGADGVAFISTVTKARDIKLAVQNM